MYAFNAPIVPTHNNNYHQAVNPQHLDCGRRLSFDDSVVVAWEMWFYRHFQRRL
jgi:hypothetical protein